MAEELKRARKAVLELSKTLKRLPNDPPIEEVHKLRTTVRRVEAIVAVLAQADGKEERRLLKAIEPVRKAAGGVREMDVMIANARKLARSMPGDSLTRLVEQLHIARKQNADELRRVLGRRRSAVRESLKEYAKRIRAVANHTEKTATKGSDGGAQAGIHSAAANVVRTLSEWPPLNAENIHEFRLKVKELRYILQLSDEANSDMGEALGLVQRRVGDWHDWHQLEEIAGEILNPERDGALLKRISETTGRRFQQALKEANSLRGRYLSAPRALGV
ncbi:MAG TPA: CHAD domain-containing protein [Terracidiphilus sp.]|nr:CHAD domain-containing protein [Terracidiphilus sp.]